MISQTYQIHQINQSQSPRFYNIEKQAKEQKPKPFLTVKRAKHLVLVGDGIADDTQAIKAFLRGETIVYKGFYRGGQEIGGLTIRITEDLIIPDNFHIHGCTIIGGGFIIPDKASNITIKNNRFRKQK